MHIDVKAFGKRVKVKPETATTNEDGKAEFDVRFGVLTKGDKVEFTTEEFSATVRHK